MLRLLGEKLVRQRLHSVENGNMKKRKQHSKTKKRPCLLYCFLCTNSVFGRYTLFRDMKGNQQIIL